MIERHRGDAGEGHGPEALGRSSRSVGGIAVRTGSEETPRSIAAERWEELREFRAAHPLERATVNGVSWSYVAGGTYAVDEP
jgi:hypothetical protein